MKTTRYLFTAFVAALLFIVFHDEVLAGSISRGGGSFSASRAAASPARSMGVQRTNPPPAAAPKATAAPRPSLTTTTPAAAPVRHVTVNQGAAGGSGSGFWSSFAGGAAGAAVGNVLTTPRTTVVAAPGGAAGAPIAEAPAAYAQPTTVVASSGGMSFTRGMFDFLIGTCLLAAVVFAGFVLLNRWLRWRSAQQRLEDAANAPKPFYPISLFTALQVAFAAKDVDALRRLASPNMIDELLADLPEDAGPMTLASIICRMVDEDDGCKTVRYSAEDKADGSRLSELWHWVAIDREWRLDGIQQA